MTGLCTLTLSSYRVADNVNLPLRIIPAVQEEGRARVSINLKVSADYSYKLFGSNVAIKVQPAWRLTVVRNTRRYQTEMRIRRYASPL